jgi:ketosteroid isomerase-like protein
MTAVDEIEANTRHVVDAVYEAYFAGDAEGMLQQMTNEIEVRFLGRGTYRGIDRVRQFLTMNTAKMTDLDFRIRSVVVHGTTAAVIWDEDAFTVDGRPYANHGVDIFEVGADGVRVMHVNNDIVRHRATFGRL